MRKACLLTLVGVASAGIATVVYAATDADANIKLALHKRLPKTELTAVDCGRVPGLCEIQAGSNLFYTDRGGRFLIIGRVYDMETRQDITAARLLEISPETLVGGAAKSTMPEDESANAVAAPESRAPVAGAAEKVSLAGLPQAGAIEWGGGPQTVTVFSDFRCGYCNRLHQTLADMNVKVIERPISVLGTRSISDAVICSRDKKAALTKAYNREPVPARQCDTAGLDANEAFAREHGFNGTPVIVRSDGAVVHGYRPRAFLESWLKGAS